VVSVGEGDNEQTYSYDSNGNLIRTTYADGTYMSHAWNYKNQLISTTTRSGETINYRYDHNGMRTYQHNETTGTTKRYYTSGYELETTDNTTTERIPINHMGMHLATIITTNGKTDIHYYHNDHLGTSSIVTNSNNDILDISDTLPYGETRYHDNDEGVTDYFALHEKDTDTGLTYMKARYYSPVMHRFLSIDPWEGDITNPQTLNKYSYSLNNPVNYFDPDGEEPVKKYAGTVDDLFNVLNHSPSQVGRSNGLNYMAHVGEFGLSSKLTPQPKDGYLNLQKGRYIYTEKQGWMDMSHFMFFAGRAYEYKVGGSNAPIYEAVRDGYIQELSDTIFAPHSAFSYEDLPSDLTGAVFGARYYDPESSNTFAEQLRSFLENEIGATNPESAPNYESIPDIDSKNKPSVKNTSVKPKFTKFKLN